ncbi:pseudouridine synthase [Phlyctochytrium arcticum]|nr:pseudouridine synthase [Phlyctochytrium arcticum]
MTEQTETPRRIAILYAYNGVTFQGLERSKGLKTIEGVLLSAVATIVGEADPTKRVSLVNISRASTTETGEHASRQVLSLEVTAAPNAIMPSARTLTPLLPPHIRVYEVIEMDTTFSARRTCDTRTYEYLIPTYVFAPPPPETHYCYPPMSDEEFEEQWPVNENLGPPGGLFKTIKRGMSVKRTKSQAAQVRSRSASRSERYNGAGATLSRQPSLPSPPPSPSQPIKKESGFKKFFQTLTRGGRSKTKDEEVPIHTMPRSKSRRNDSYQGSNSPSYNNQPDNVVYGTSADREDDFGLMATLKRSVSRKSTRRRDPELASLSGATGAEAEETKPEPEPEFFEPLPFSPVQEEEMSLVRQYRLTDDQINALNHIIAIYNGTHNWHNYIPGAKYEDSRCYMRILNIECSKPEVHFGMEWVRIKVQAKAFARYQVRKMLSMAIMVIRTNTPRSIVANSFGFAKIDIPEAPACGLILDTPHYDTFNSDCERRGVSTGIHFDKFANDVTQFRHHAIHDSIYRSELESMKFYEWARNIDAYSFLYTYFLNERGVIKPNTHYVSKTAIEHERAAAERARQGVADGLFVKDV